MAKEHAKRMPITLRIGLALVGLLALTAMADKSGLISHSGIKSYQDAGLERLRVAIVKNGAQYF